MTKKTQPPTLPELLTQAGAILADYQKALQAPRQPVADAVELANWQPGDPLRCIRPFKWSGKMYNPGDLFTPTDSDQKARIIALASKRIITSENRHELSQKLAGMKDQVQGLRDAVQAINQKQNVLDKAAAAVADLKAQLAAAEGRVGLAAGALDQAAGALAGLLDFNA